MPVEIHKGFFKDRNEVMEDLKKTGFWPTTYVSAPSPALPVHWHDVDINGYVISGNSTIIDGESGDTITVEAGDKLVIPSGTLHAEGEVCEPMTYIVATSRAGQLFELLEMKTPP